MSPEPGGAAREPGRTPRGRPDTARPNHTKLHLTFVSIDESALVMNIRVSGHHRCVECDWNERVLFALNVQEYASHAAFGRRLASGPFSTPYLAWSFLNA